MNPGTNLGPGFNSWWLLDNLLLFFLSSPFLTFSIILNEWLKSKSRRKAKYFVPPTGTWTLDLFHVEQAHLTQDRVHHPKRPALRMSISAALSCPAPSSSRRGLAMRGGQLTERVSLPLSPRGLLSLCSNETHSLGLQMARTAFRKLGGIVRGKGWNATKYLCPLWLSRFRQTFVHVQNLSNLCPIFVLSLSYFSPCPICVQLLSAMSMVCPLQIRNLSQIRELQNQWSFPKVSRSFLVIFILRSQRSL